MRCSGTIILKPFDQILDLTRRLKQRPNPVPLSGIEQTSERFQASASAAIHALWDDLNAVIENDHNKLCDGHRRRAGGKIRFEPPKQRLNESQLYALVVSYKLLNPSATGPSQRPHCPRLRFTARGAPKIADESCPFRAINDCLMELPFIYNNYTELVLDFAPNDPDVEVPAPKTLRIGFARP